MASQDNSVRLGLAYCFAVAVLLGYGTQLATVGAPQIVAEFHFKSNELGLIFSAGSVGMLIGNIAGGRLGDGLGRRTVLACAVSIMGLATGSLIFAADVASWAAMRCIAGIGFGAAMPNMIALGATLGGAGQKFSTNAAIFWGISLGGVTVAGLGSLLLPWRTAFWAGSLIPLALAALAFVVLPRDSRSVEAKVKLNTANVLFGEGRWRSTLLVWGAFIAGYVTTYLVTSWFPMLTVERGLGAALGAQTMLAFNLAGIGGVLVLGKLSDMFGYRAPLVCAFAVACVALFVFSRVTDPVLVLAMSAVVGFANSGSMVLLFAVAAAQYPAHAQGVGSGTALAVGRCGSISAPLIGGMLLQIGTAPADVVIFPAITSMLAASLIWILGAVRAKAPAPAA